MIPSSAAITKINKSIPVAPATIFLINLSCPGTSTIPASIPEGKNELLKVLDEEASKIIMKPEDQPFRLPIDGVFTVKGFGTVVRGTAISGKVTLNQVLKIYPKEIETKVRNIQVHGKNVEISYAGMRTALNLQGVEKEQIERGDVVAEPGVLKSSQWLDIKLTSLKDIKYPIKNFENLLLYVGTTEVIGKIQELLFLLHLQWYL